MQMMSACIRLLVSALALCSNAAAFNIPLAESFHMVQSAANTAAHLTHAPELLTAYKNTLVQHPLPTKMLTGATLAVCGDAIAQSKDKDADYDVRRASSFAVFDMAYRALQHASFPVIVKECQGQFITGALAATALPIATAVDTHAAAAMEQTLASQLIIVPFLYYPAFFALTGAVQGLGVEGAMSRAKENFLPLMKRNLLFWIPVQFVQFGFIQEDLQIPFLSVCGLMWTFILSVAAGSAKKYSEPNDPTEQLEALEQEEQQPALASTRSAGIASSKA